MILTGNVPLNQWDSKLLDLLVGVKMCGSRKKMFTGVLKPSG